jgi:hypothetical protein
MASPSGADVVWTHVRVADRPFGQMIHGCTLRVRAQYHVTIRFSISPHAYRCYQRAYLSVVLQYTSTLFAMMQGNIKVLRFTVSIVIKRLKR